MAKKRKPKPEPPPKREPSPKRALPIRQIGIALACLAAVGAAYFFSTNTKSEGSPPGEYRGRGVGDVAFVSSDTCVECHPDQAAEWQASHHRLAMERPDETTVLADFDGSSFTHFEETLRFLTRDGEYFVSMERPGEETKEFAVRYTFGADPLQQYLIEGSGGRLQCLTAAWDVNQKRWFHLYPDQDISPDDALHWTGRYQVWNHMCASCHTTDLRKNYDVDSDAYQTTWSEISVQCQACHGPGEDHVEWARSLPEGATPDPSQYSLAVEFKGREPETEIQACAPCHSRRQTVTADGRQGGGYYDEFMVQTLSDGLYHADGQILEEVYVYGSFIQSKMYHEGVRCSDCHNPHSLELHRPGNAVCVRCHTTSAPAEFPEMKTGEYDTEKHHFHPADSDGAQCANCHAPERTYMVVDPRRDHSFRVPRPDLTIKLGTPNACNGCHKEKSPEWADQAVAKWYGPDRRREPHFGEAIAAGREHSPGAESKLIQLALDKDQPAIARATALELLQEYTIDGATAMIQSIQDDNPIIRTRAVGGLGRIPPQARLDSVAEALDDPVRSVRVEAARVLGSVPEEMFKPDQRRKFEAALAEYEASQRYASDVPAGHMNLARLEAERGREDRAETHYQRALELDPHFAAAALELARVYNQQTRNDEAEKLLREAIKRTPDEPEIYYSLGLLLAELQRLSEAEEYLGKAVELAPSQVRMRYNHALSLQRLGRRPQAERAFLEAHQIDRTNGDVINALAIFYMQERRLLDARRFAERLVALNPRDPGPQQLLMQIEQGLSVPR